MQVMGRKRAFFGYFPGPASVCWLALLVVLVVFDVMENGNMICSDRREGAGWGAKR